MNTPPRAPVSARLGVQSVALVILLASTWLLVGTSLTSADTATVSAGRTVFTVLGLAALTHLPGLQREKPPRHPRPTTVQVTLLGLTGVTAYTVFSTAAIALAGPALPSLLISLTPAVVLVADSLLRRSAPSRRALLGTGIAVVGAIAYVLPRLAPATPGNSMLLGAAAALAAMLSMAFYGLYFAAVNRDYHGPMAPRILPIFTAGAIPLAVWAAADSAGTRLSWSTVALLAVLGTVVYVPAYLLQHTIIITAGPAYAALLGLAVAPLVGVSSAALGLAGPLTVPQLAATAVTILGMALVIARPATKKSGRGM
jgi:drug/metabolite transporter (DMT)-like permease